MTDARSLPVEIRNLRKTFRGPDGKPFAAVDNLSVVLPEPGAIVSLIGPDGAGKTTLLRLLAGILTPDDGEISLFGKKPDTDDPDFVAMLGFMPQRFGLYEELSVWENFRIFGALRGIREKALEARFRDLMTLSGLRGFESREAGKLSGGMKQKLGLSCSLLAEPKLLLLDEPTVGVDPLSRRELWRIRRRSRGKLRAGPGSQGPETNAEHFRSHERSCAKSGLRTPGPPGLMPFRTATPSTCLLRKTLLMRPGNSRTAQRSLPERPPSKTPTARSPFRLPPKPTRSGFSRPPIRLRSRTRWSRETSPAGSGASRRSRTRAFP